MATWKGPCKTLRNYANYAKSRLKIYSQTELDLESHRCIVNKQKYSLSSVQGFIDAVLRYSLHPSNNNFPKAILFDYKGLFGDSQGD